MRHRWAPGPKGHWATGCLRQMANPLVALRDVAQRYGDIAHFRLGPPIFGTHAFLLQSPELIRRVLVDRRAHYDKGRSARLLRETLGDGLLTSDGDTWRRQRRELDPLLRSQAVELCFPAMQACLSRHMAMWREVRGLTFEVDLAKEMLDLNVELTSAALFGMEGGPGAARLRAALEVLEDDAVSRILHLLPDWRRVSTRARRARERALAEVRAFADTAIMHVRSTRGERWRGLLAPLIDGMSAADSSKLLRDQVLTMIVAGHETTASALSWTFFLLASHPQVKRRLQDELDAIRNVEGVDPAPTLTFSYTHQCLLEALRLFPPGWSLERCPIGDEELGGYHVPAGSIVLISAYVIHRDARHWPRPDEFDPDRFSEDMVASLSPFVYFPFGAGSRRCIGASLAMLQSLSVLSSVVRTWDFSLLPGQQIVPEPRITLRPGPTLRMALQLR